MSEPLTITLSPHWRIYLEGLVQNRRFASLDDAIESGVRLLESREHSGDRLAQLLEEGEREGGFEEWDYEKFKAEVRQDEDACKAA